MLMFLMAPAATSALNIRSSIGVPRESFLLVWNGNAFLVAMASDQDLDHVGDAAMLARCGLPDRSLEPRFSYNFV